jgi:hypothetical protein
MLGGALLACALALFWYGASNSPRTWRDSDNVNRAALFNTVAQPTPSASPSSTPNSNGGARPAR